MKNQLTVRLPDELSRALKAASHRMHRSSSEIVRMALQEFFATGAGAKRPLYHVRDLVGSVESGIPDIAHKHRAYILESLERGQ